MWPARKTAQPKDLGAQLAEDWRVLLVLPTALVLQVSHPVIGAGVGQYSNYATDPWGRAVRSVWPVLAMLLIEDNGYGADLRALHKQIGGVDDRGRPYHAWNPEAAFFVLATGAYGSEQIARVFGTPLTVAQREEVFRAWRRAGETFGIPDRDLPADLAAYDEWFRTIVEERLEDNQTVRELFSTLTSPPAPPFVPGFLWRPIAERLIAPILMLVVLGTLPEVLRDRLGLTWTTRQERRLRIVGRIVRLVNAVLPAPLRSINGLIVRRFESQMREYASRGAALGIAPSIADRSERERVA